MNLFYTITSYPPSIGGAQSNLHEICRRLKDKHNVQVASFWTENRTDWLLGTTVNAPGGKPYTIDGVNVTPISYTNIERTQMIPWVLGYYFWQTKTIHEISHIIQEKLRTMCGQPDLIHHGRVGREPLADASLALARQLGIPFVLTTYHHPRWNSWFYRYYQHIYRQADALIALTEAEKEMLVQLGVKREKIFVTGTGAVLSDTYNAHSFSQKYALNGQTVLFLGQKYKYKGFLALLKAAPMVWRKYPQTKFLFIGPRTNYSRWVFSNIRDPRLIELETLSLEEKTSAIAACDILCLPSKQECFGSVYVEAWVMGKPVIGADIPTVSSVITNCLDGLVGKPDPSFLSEKITELLDDPSLRQRMGANGQKKAEALYKWPTLAGKLEKTYQTILGVT